MPEAFPSLTSQPSAQSMLNCSPQSPVGAQVAQALLRDYYKIEGAVSLVASERDENFHIKLTEGRSLIFKVFGLSQHQSDADLLASVLTHLARNARSLPVPRLTQSYDSHPVISFLDYTGRERHAVLYSFLPGKLLMDAYRSSDQQRQCGAILANIAIALKTFSHPRMHRSIIWDLRHLPALRGLLPQIDELPYAAFIRNYLDEYSQRVAERLAVLPQQIVHNDFNARNIIVDERCNDRVTGIIDFGDAVYTARVADIAVGVIGQLSDPDAANRAMTAFVEAYQEISPLQPDENALLPWLVAGRIVQNVVVTSWYRSRNPANEHFAGFGRDFFGWRIEFAERLQSTAQS